MLSRRLAAAPLVALAFCALGGCAPSQEARQRAAVRADLDAARQRWAAQHLTDYAFTYSSSGQAGTNTWRVTVRSRGVVEVRRLRTNYPVPYTGAPLEQIFDSVAQALRTADSVSATFDARSGAPTTVSVDRLRDARDDEYGFGVSDLATLPNPQ